MKLSDYVWSYIANLGVHHVFMFPGGGAMHLVDSLGKNDKIEYVTLLHEQACTMAAETYARIDYNLGVALVTTGPGGTNAVTGVAAAWLESTPMMVISGQVKTEDLKTTYGVRQRGNQEIGIVDIVSSITKYAVTIMDPYEIKNCLDQAVYKATHGRPGPVWIDIPLDIQAAEIDVDTLKSFQESKQQDNDNGYIQECVEKTIDLLKNARRPVIIAGQGIERGNGKETFRELVDKLKIPVLLSWIATELLAYDHPYNMGKPGMVAPRYSNFTMQESDLVIAIGTRLDTAMIGYNASDFAPNAKKVVVDIDATELNKFSFEVDLKVEADATQFIKILLKEIQQQNIKICDSKWLEQCQAWKQKYPVVLDGFKESESGVNPYFFIDKLSDWLEDNDVVIPGSSGAGIDVFWMCIKNKENQRLLATGALGSMGYGIPAAIGAQMATGRRVICVEGDGSLQLNIQELASIRGMNLPIKIFINGNGGYLSIMNMQRNHFQGNFVGANKGSHLYIPDIIAVAKSYGLKTFEIFQHKDIDVVIPKIMETEGPTLCYVHMRDDIPIQPKVMSRVDKNGSMISGNLKNLWPFLDGEDK